jgi:hypothetical protein
MRWRFWGKVEQLVHQIKPQKEIQLIAGLTVNTRLFTRSKAME